VRVVAGGSVVIGLLDGRTGGAQGTWGNVYVLAQTGAISDAGSNGSTSVRVYGQGVSLAAAGNIGGINTPVYKLQYTTDFATWTDLVTVSTGDTSVTYVDPVPADSRRFYRVAYGTAGVTVSLRAPQILADRSVRLTWDVTYTGSYVPVTKALVIEGAVLAAESGVGSVAVNDANSVSVGDVLVGYRTVAANGTLNALADDGVKSDVRTVAGNGSVYLQALNGNLVLTDGSTGVGAAVSASGSGQILLGATGSVTVAGSVVTGSGHITVAGPLGVSMSGGTTLTTNGGEVNVSSAAGSVTVTVVSTGGGDVRVAGQTGVTVSTVNAGAGRVSLLAAAGSILDGTDAGVNVTASAVRLQAGGGIGALNDEFVLQTALVTVGAGGVVRLANTGDLTVGSVSVTVATVGANGVVTGVTDAAQAGVGTVNSLVLVNTGNLAVEATIGVSGAGHVLLNATGNITVNSGVTLANGSVSVVAGGALNLNATLSVTGGTADVVALGGNVVTQRVTTVGGNIRISAGGSVTLGVADARNGADQNVWGDVSVSAAGGSVTDAGVDLLVNIYGRNVRVSATGTAGTLFPAAADALEIDALTLAVGGSSVNVVLSNGTTITAVGAVGVDRVRADGTLEAAGDAGSLSGIVATTGIVVRTLAGNLAVQAAITNGGSGNVLLSATGGNVSATANVSVAGGSLSVLASGNVTLADGILLSVTGGTADVQAGGSVVMGGSTTVRTAGGNIRVGAGATVALGLLDARTGGAQGTWGDVSVVAVAGSVVDGGDDAAVDIYGRNLRIVSGVAVGVTGSNVVETEVATVAISTGAGGVSLLDASGLAVGTVAAVGVNRVQNDGSVAAAGDAGALTGVVKTGGLMALDTADGSNIAGFPTFEVLDNLTSLSPASVYTGLYEQRVRITNTTGSTIDAVRVAIGNLPAGVVVMDAAGTTGDGRAYIQYNQPLAAGQAVVLVIEYKVPTLAQMPVAPTFEVDVTGLQAPPALTGAVLLVNGVFVQRLADNRYTVSIQSLSGRTYYIQYSDDNGITWTTVLSPLTGTGSTLTWLDFGPPKTSANPNTSITRSYKVFLMP
jgi:hypothetical protein